MNCKSCGYGLKQSCGDFEKIICTYEEGECVKIIELEKQIKKMKSIGRTAYIKGIRTMANALKRYDRTDGAWTDYFEHKVDTVLTRLLKEIKEND